MIVGLLALPVAIIGLVLCSPVIVASLGGSVSEAIKKKQTNHQLLETFKHVLVFKQSVDDLQQTFNEDFENPQHPNTGKPLLNSYNILPSRSDYTLDILGKSLTYFPAGKIIALKFQFKQPYPTRANIQEVYDQSTFENKLGFNIQTEPGMSSYPVKGSEYIKTCTLTYSRNYNVKKMYCSGFRIPVSDE